MTATTIFWDVGGVFSARPVDAAAHVATDLGISTESLLEAVFGPYHLDTGHHWHRLERGEVSLSEAWDDVQAALDEAGAGDLDLAGFFKGFSHDEADRTIVTQTVLDLHQSGIRHGIITNNVKEFSADPKKGWRTIVPMTAIAEVIDSAFVGCRKPDPAIYRLALDRMGVNAEESAFCDDMPANVEAANALGMHGVVVEADPTEAMTELRRWAAAG